MTIEGSSRWMNVSSDDVSVELVLSEVVSDDVLMLDVTSELNVDELQPARTIIAASKKVSFPFITNQGASLRLPFLFILSQ